MEAINHKQCHRQVVFLRVLCVLLFAVLACCAVLIVQISTLSKCVPENDVAKATVQHRVVRNDDVQDPVDSSIKVTDSDSGTSSTCAKGLTVTPEDESNPGIFQDLNELEINAVKDYLFKETDLDLIPEENATDARANYILYMDVHLPTKSEALAHLDSGGHKPARKARVVIAKGKDDPPYIREYVVGDLPNPSTINERTTESYSVYPIPFNRRPITTVEETYIDEVIKPQIDKDLSDLLIWSYDSAFTKSKCGDKCLQLVENYLDNPTPGSTEATTERKYWLFAQYNVTGYYLHYLGFGVLFDATSMNKNDWTTTSVYYSGQTFESMTALKAYFKQNKNLIARRVLFPTSDTKFSDMKRHPSNDDNSDSKAGPRLVEPEGRRYQITGRRVEYRGWSFHVGVDTVHGPRLNDIRFRSERIAYELSIQEVAILYGGNNPYTWSSFYLDTTEQIGASISRLAKGVDCPETAAYMDLVFFTTFHQEKRQSVCVFEQNGGLPLRRHYADDYEGGYTFYGGVVDTYLVVRTITSVYNYDYLFDFIFRANGAIQIRITATGYPQVAFPTINETRYGNLLQKKYALGNVHQHLFHVKADLDIIDTENRFETIDFSTETIQTGYNQKTLQQLAMTTSQKITEKQAAIKFDFQKPKYYVVYTNKHTNNKTTDANGLKRGYRIHNEAMTPLLYGESSKASGIKWANYQMSVTVQKDEERYSSHYRNGMFSKDPVVDFQTFIDDDEGIVDKDLVTWISMGTYHLPSSEDSPVTSTTGNQFSVYLKPFNYFPECPSSSSRDAIYIDHDGGAVKTEMYGVNRKLVCVPKDQPIGYN